MLFGADPRRLPRRSFGAVLLAVLLVAGAAAFPLRPSSAGAYAPLEPLITSEGDTGCNPLSHGTCVMPWPSPWMRVSDPTSPTGVRTRISSELFEPVAVDRLPATLKQELSLTGWTGFATTGPALFDMPVEWAPESIPRNGGGAVLAFDTATGAATPIIASKNRIAGEVSRPAPVLQVVPRDIWQPKHRYLIVVTDQVQRVDGSPMGPSPNLARVIAGDQSAPGFAIANHLLTEAERLGINRQRVIHITEYIARDTAEITQPMLVKANEIASRDHPIEITRVERFPDGPIAAYVRGRVMVDDFRNGDGMVKFDHAPRAHWVDFTMTVPWQTAPAKAPMLIYGHGLMVDRSTILAWAHDAARHGFATIAIDHPYHGTRIPEEGFLENLFTPEDISRVAGLLVQSPLDHVALLTAIRQHLGSVDLVGPNGNGPDGLPDLNTERVSYSGTSLGAILGATFAAIAPKLDAAWFEVAGAGIIDIIPQAQFWQELDIENSVDSGSSGYEAAALYAGFQHVFDAAEPANFATWYKSPPPGRSPTPIALHYSIDDHVVANDSSMRFARIAGLTQTGRAFHPIADVPYSADPTPWFVFQSPNSQGPELIKSFPDLLPESFNKRAMAFLLHIGFWHPVTMEMRDRWLEVQNPGVRVPAPPPAMTTIVGLLASVPFLVAMVLDVAVNGPPPLPGTVNAP
ncbi:MAG: hypothetical protein KA110_04760 [Acidimicrobiia bacterium]|nr:hypothetical protein [Acidimicrobiia bacterium]